MLVVAFCAAQAGHSNWVIGDEVTAEFLRHVEDFRIEVKSYRGHFVIQPSDHSEEGTLDVILPATYRLRYGVADEITIGPERFLYDSHLGTWKLSSKSASPSVPLNPLESYGEAIIRNELSVAKGGERKLKGQTCREFQVSLPGSRFPRATFCFTRDGSLLRFKQEDSQRSSFTIVYSDFNDASINVSPPTDYRIATPTPIRLNQ